MVGIRMDVSHHSEKCNCDFRKNRGVSVSYRRFLLIEIYGNILFICFYIHMINLR